MPSPDRYVAFTFLSRPLFFFVCSQAESMFMYASRQANAARAACCATRKTRGAQRAAENAQRSMMRDARARSSIYHARAYAIC